MRVRPDIIVRNIGQLLTMDPAGQGAGGLARGVPVGGDFPGGPEAGLGLVEDAVVAVAQDRILAAGPRHKLEPVLDETAGTTTFDAAGGVVSPGLIDPHTHLLFSGWREGEFAERLEGRPYLEILASGGGILSTVRRFRAAPDDELLAWGRAALDRMLLSGTTTVEAKSGYGLSAGEELRALRLLRRLGDEHPVTVVATFLGAHAVPPEYRDRPRPATAYVDEVCLPLLPRIQAEGLARFCDVFCEVEVFSPDQSRRVLEAGLAHGLAPKIHADQKTSLGGTALAADLRAVSADHLEHVRDRDMADLAGAGTVAVLLPGAAFTLMESVQAPARRLIGAGVPVALASDFNPGTCPVLSMPLILGLACLRRLLTPAEALVAATINAAYAVGLGDEVGSLEPGKLADAAILNASSHLHLFYWFGRNLVQTVVKDGKVVHTE